MLAIDQLYSATVYFLKNLTALKSHDKIRGLPALKAFQKIVYSSFLQVSEIILENELKFILEKNEQWFMARARDHFFSKGFSM